MYDALKKKLRKKLKINIQQIDEYKTHFSNDIIHISWATACCLKSDLCEHRKIINNEGFEEK